MKYRKLELTIFIIGLLAVLASIIISINQKAHTSEIVGQALFVPVFFLALHYGRRAGFAAAVSASLLYLVIKTPDLGNINLSFSGLTIIGHTMLFGVTGILGGELAVRTKYLVVGFDKLTPLDPQTNLYNTDYINQLLKNLLFEYSSRNRIFSILFLKLDWHIPADEATNLKVINRFASLIMHNVRLVDEIGHFDDGSFCLIMPDNSSRACEIVYARINKIFLADRLLSTSASIKKRVLSVPANLSDITQLVPADLLKSAI